MVIPSQDLIKCKGCGVYGEPHKQHRLFCIACGRRKGVEYARKHREKLKAQPKAVICKGCGGGFSTQGSGRTWRCQPCTSAYNAERAHLYRERNAASSRRY